MLQTLWKEFNVKYYIKSNWRGRSTWWSWSQVQRPELVRRVVLETNFTKYFDLSVGLGLTTPKFEEYLGIWRSIWKFGRVLGFINQQKIVRFDTHEVYFPPNPKILLKSNWKIVVLGWSWSQVQLSSQARIVVLRTNNSTKYSLFIWTYIVFENLAEYLRIWRSICEFGGVVEDLVEYLGLTINKKKLDLILMRCTLFLFHERNKE